MPRAKIALVDRFRETPGFGFGSFSLSKKSPKIAHIESNPLEEDRVFGAFGTLVTITYLRQTILRQLAAASGACPCKRCVNVVVMVAALDRRDEQRKARNRQHDRLNLVRAHNDFEDEFAQ